MTKVFLLTENVWKAPEAGGSAAAPPSPHPHPALRDSLLRGVSSRLARAFFSCKGGKALFSVTNRLCHKCLRVIWNSRFWSDPLSHDEQGLGCFQLSE